MDIKQERMDQVGEWPEMERRQTERRATPASPAPSDLSKELREYASNPGYGHGDYADTMRQAADEIDRMVAAPAKPQSDLHSARAKLSAIREQIMHDQGVSVMDIDGVLRDIAAADLVATAQSEDSARMAAEVDAARVEATRIYMDLLKYRVAAAREQALEELSTRVRDMREAAYTYGEYSMEAVRIALDGVLEAIDESAKESAKPVAASVGAQVAGEPVRWEVLESTGWEPLAASHVEHAKAHGRAVRALGVITAPVPAPATVDMNADSPQVRSAIRRVLQHHKLTEHGNGVVEADIAYAVIDALKGKAAPAEEYVPEYKTVTDHNDKVIGMEWVNADKRPPVAVAPVAGEGLALTQSQQATLRAIAHHIREGAQLRKSDADDLVKISVALAPQAERQPQPAAQAAVPYGWLYGNSFWERSNPRTTDHIKQHGFPLFAAPAAVPQGVEAQKGGADHG